MCKVTPIINPVCKVTPVINPVCKVTPVINPVCRVTPVVPDRVFTRGVVSPELPSEEATTL